MKFAGVIATMATIGLGGYAAIRLINILFGRMEGKDNLPPGSDVEELRARIEELEADRGRLLELEERVDFTERVLAGDSQVRNKLEASP